ncbi:histidine phosphatase family protein [Xenorhabdus sp. Reich]|uniref:Histidine phosphatase family protein n=1 Tax=Xenorhabdus littoralis TaxID=2582835 RepID=A0ABU4SJS1_9GAMM|nr:histidine phosphatase family protein [Xenorhabdus sp. Reich]MDX7998913.1 histidine phosphatase family protein [Xenorhabdus sp. Reich]
MRIIAVRHAETQWNIDGIIQGRLDSPVTEKGFRQIDSLLAAIKNFPIRKVNTNRFRFDSYRHGIA